MTKNDINVPRLRLFVGALREVVETLPEAAVVDLKSVKPPTCGTPGCHAGLAMLALDLLGVEEPPFHFGSYDYSFQALRLSNYLMDDKSDQPEPTTALPVSVWAEKNFDAWGGPFGLYMFASPSAFGVHENTFPSAVIVNKWAAVLDRLESKP